MARHNLLRILAVLVLALVFIACQPSAQPSVTQPTSPPPALATTAPPAQPTTAAAAPATAVPTNVPATTAPTSAPATTAPAAAAGTPRWGGTLVTPRVEEPSCNPVATSSLLMTRNAFDMLARLNAKLEPQPELAESWDIAKDGKTITFKLRKDVKWHDGKPFTSADVKFTFEKALSKIHPRGRLAFAALDRVDTPDDYTAVILMKEGNAGFMFQVSTESWMLPKHIYENEDLATGPHATCKELPVGTGAFKVTEVRPGIGITMVRNPDWWGTKGTYWDKGAPYLDKIVVPFVPYADATARVNGLLTGEFDYLTGEMLPQNAAEQVSKTPGRKVIYACQGPYAQTMLGINLREKSKPLSDIRVRQAIAWSLDLEDINKRVYFGTGSPGNSFVQVESVLYNPKIKGMYQPRDYAKANALLDEAGFKKGADGYRFEVKVNLDNRPWKTDFAAVLKQAFDAIGVKTNLDVGDVNYWVDKTYMKHDYDISILGLGVNDPGVGASRLFLSTNIGEASFNNSSAYVNPEMDQLWKTYNTSFDEKERRDAIYKIQEIVQRDLPYIYVNNNIEPAAYNTDKIEGVASDCVFGFDLLRTIWSKSGRPNP